MAHAPELKAQAQAMLMTGDAPQYVADQLGLPYATVKRWQGEGFDRMAALIGPVELTFFDFSPEMDTKTKRTPKRGSGDV